MIQVSKKRYGWERLTLAIGFVLGLGLLYVSSCEGIEKFWEKLTEALGTALVLVVVMDVFFKDLITWVHSKDHAGQILGLQWIEGSKHQQAEDEKAATKEAQEQMARSVKALLEKVEHIDRALKASPGR